MNTKEGDTFNIDNDGELEVIETPGHLDDHLSFLYKSPNNPSVLFTGDHILSIATVKFA